MVAVGNRQIQGVADGEVSAASTNAINGSQLYAVATGLNTNIGALGTNTAKALGGTAAYNTTTGAWTAPSYTIGATTYNDVGSALTALATGGASAKYFHTKSTLADSAATGTDSVAIGPQASASGTNSIAIGNLASATKSGSIAFGDNSSSTAANSVALGGSSVAGAANAGWAGTKIGQTTMINNLSGNAVIGVSGGSINRQITGVADAAVNATSTDAVNGSQLYAAVNALSNLTSSVPVVANNTSAYAYPTATGKDATAVGFGSTATGKESIAIGPGATASGANSVVIGVGSSDGGVANTVSIGKVGGERTITNLAPGSTKVGSTEAVNGGQLNTGLASVATNLGGGSVFDPVTGKVTAPTYTIGGTPYNDVGSALGALASGGAKSKYFNATSVLADSVATGTDSVEIGPVALSKALNGVSIGNGATATNANDVALGAGSTTAAPNTGAFTLNGGTAAATTAASVVSVGSAGKERQITNVGAGVVSATSTDAINGSQLYTTATAVNNLGASTVAALGGGIVLNADGTTKTSPTFNVDGSPYSNVAAAIAALDKTAGAAIDVNNTSALANPTATGKDATAISPGAVASGADSLAAGKNALASGAQSVALGDGAKATGTSTVALGDNAQATATDATAQGLGRVKTLP